MHHKLVRIENRFVSINVIKLGCDNFTIQPNDQKQVKASLKETISYLFHSGIKEQEIVNGMISLIENNCFRVSFSLSGNLIGSIK